MFRKLRLKLMLVNLSVIVLLFLLLITGTYFFVQGEMIKGGKHMMQRVSRDLVMGKSISFPPEPPDHNQEDDGPPRPMIFFIKTNLAGDVIQASPSISLTNAQLSRFALETQKTGETLGSLIFDKTEYHYQITPADDNQSVFIVFHDFQRDRNLLNMLVTGLSITGIVCMILSLFGSLFMANRAMIPIQNSWQQQKDFLADASHEFRTPLAIIQTNLEIVRDNPEETVRSQEHWLSNIHEETLCMTKLVESLLFLARADSHQQLLIKDDFQLGQTIMIAAELFRPVAAIQGVTLDLQVETHIPYCGDEAKLRQVVGILLDNAIRHTPTGGKITINLENSHQGILLSVTDTGEGIPPEHLEKIFERFYQSDSSRSQGGTGLGLSIAKWIIESHNGSISALSTPGTGSIFNVVLPYL
ncbi:MAG: sasA 9 [Firmicutes bacterium]|nr:sasA 9 [Bacillota bacterium]